MSTRKAFVMSIGLLVWLGSVVTGCYIEYPHPDSFRDHDDDNGGDCDACCDCPDGTECVDGECKTPCEASCDCEEGEVCQDGYCEEPKDPPETCEVSCDCPQGETCEEGVCKPE